MSRELINRITLKKDGVYLSHKSNNCDENYYSNKVEFLFDAYWRGGQKGLDIEIIKLLEAGNELRGNHKSIIPYKRVMQDYYTFGKYPIKSQIYNYQTLALDNNYDEGKVGMSKKNLLGKIEELRSKLYSELADDVAKYRAELKQENVKEKEEVIEEVIEETQEILE